LGWGKYNIPIYYIGMGYPVYWYIYWSKIRNRNRYCGTLL
jgi:hypothetical protein